MSYANGRRREEESLPPWAQRLIGELREENRRLQQGMALAEVVRLVRGRCEAAGSQKDFAGLAGVSQAYISDVLNGKREPGQKLLAAIGLRRTVVYTSSEEKGA